MSRAARLVVMMIRPPAAAVILLFAAIGLAEAGAGDALHPLFTVLPLVLGGWFVHATVVNDLGDERIDRVNLANARGRPLISGDATAAELRSMGRVAATIALVLAFAVDWRVGLVVVGGLLLNLAYSVPPVRLSDRGLVASLVLPAGFVLVPFLAGVLSVQPAVRSTDVPLVAALYLAFVGRIMVKDFRDARGDELFGKRTFLVRHGRERTCAVSAAFWTVGCAALLVVVRESPVLVVGIAVLLGCALHGLRRLASTTGYAAEQVVIGSIAQSGRGIGIALLAHLTMIDKAWPAAAEAFVVLALVAVFTGLYAVNLGARERVPVAAIRPW